MHDPASAPIPSEEQIVLRERLELAIAAATRIKRGLVVLALQAHPPSGSFVFGADVEPMDRELRGRLRGCLARTDVLCAEGPLRYAVVLERAERGLFFVDVADAILREVARPMVLDGREVFLVGSVGIALCPDDGDHGEALIDHACSAMEGAQGAGGNLFGFYSSAIGSATSRRLKLARALEAALARDEFTLVYQPQVDARSGELRGVEALLRWNTVVDGAAPGPAEFVPILEESDRIGEVGAWVLGEACRQACAWRDSGIRVRVGVNVSARQLQQPGFVDGVEAVLARSGLPAERLELELTESVLVDNPATTRTQLEALRRRGVRVAIDDFGTGFASLSYIRQFPMDTIKIDREFVRGLPVNHENAAITSAIVALAHSLKLETVAEGVENEAEQEFMRSLHCRLIQGYLHARPMPPDELVRWHARRD